MLALQIACKFCAEQKSAEAIARLQLEPLLQAGEGRIELAVYNLPGGLHVRMFHSDSSYCGVILRGKDARQSRRQGRSWVYYKTARYGELCGKCREKIEELMAEAHAAAAMKQA
jgi:hypothetical protein